MATSAAVEPVANAAPACRAGTARLGHAAHPDDHPGDHANGDETDHCLELLCSRWGSCPTRARAAPRQSRMAAPTPIHALHGVATVLLAQERRDDAHDEGSPRPSRRPMTNVGSMVHFSEPESEVTLTFGTTSWGRIAWHPVHPPDNERMFDTLAAMAPRQGDDPTCRPRCVLRRSSSSSTCRYEESHRGRWRASSSLWRRTRRRRSACTAMSGRRRPRSATGVRRRSFLRVPAPRRRGDGRPARLHAVGRAGVDRRSVPRRVGFDAPLRHAHEIAAEIRRRARRDRSAHLGRVATTKHLAKVASQVASPTARGGGAGRRVPRPVARRAVGGIGPSPRAPGRRGIHTVGQLHQASPDGCNTCSVTPRREAGALAANEDPRDRNRAARTIGARRFLGRKVVTEQLQETLGFLADRAATRLRKAARVDARSRCGCAPRHAVRARARCRKRLDAHARSVCVELVKVAMADNPHERELSLLAISVSNLEAESEHQLALASTPT